MSREFNAQSWLLSLYLGTAPVYWLPGLSASAVALGKISLFLLAIGMVYFRVIAAGKIHLPKGLWGPVGIWTLIMLSTPGLYQAKDVSSMIAFIVDIVSGAMFLWCFFNLTLQGAGLLLIFRRSMIIITFFAALTVVNKLTGLPDWHAPADLAGFYQPLIRTGFGVGSTGWSNGLALYLPLALFLFMKGSGRGSLFRRVIGLVMVGCLFGSQFASGGRAGLLASLLTIVAFIYFSLPRWLKVSAILGILLATTVSSMSVTTMNELPETWNKHLRLNRLPDKIEFISDLDHFSAGRITGYLTAIKRFWERPFLGHGNKQILMEYKNRQIEIHNLWLKWAVESGIFAPLFFSFMIIVLLFEARRLVAVSARSTADRDAALAFVLIILSGMVISQFEPNALIGSFQNSAIWWAAVGSLLSLLFSNSPDIGSRVNAAGSGIGETVASSTQPAFR